MKLIGEIDLPQQVSVVVSFKGNGELLAVSLGRRLPFLCTDDLLSNLIVFHDQQALFLLLRFIGFLSGLFVRLNGGAELIGFHLFLHLMQTIIE